MGQSGLLFSHRLLCALESSAVGCGHLCCISSCWRMVTFLATLPERLPEVPFDLWVFGVSLFGVQPLPRELLWV